VGSSSFISVTNLTRRNTDIEFAVHFWSSFLSPHAVERIETLSYSARRQTRGDMCSSTVRDELTRIVPRSFAYLSSQSVEIENKMFINNTTHMLYLLVLFINKSHDVKIFIHVLGSD